MNSRFSQTIAACLRKHALRAAVLCGVDRLFRRLNRHEILIVMYHGVVEGPTRYSNWSQLPAAEFRRQIDFLKQHYTVLPLVEVVQAMRAGRPLPPNAAIVTFDDGFENNCTVAYPYLKQHQVPATVFLATGHIGTRTLCWPDELFVTILETEKQAVDLRDYNLGSHRLRTTEERHDAYEEILVELKRLDSEVRDRIYPAVTESLGGADDDVPYRRDFCAMSWQQAAEMHSSGLIDFGGHTVHHEILSRLDSEQMRSEITESCEAIRENLGTQTMTFAYPNGGRDDFTDEAKRVLRDERALCGLSTIEGLNGPDADLYALKRIPVGAGMTSNEFALQCSGFAAWARRLLRRHD